MAGEALPVSLQTLKHPKGAKALLKRSVARLRLKDKIKLGRISNEGMLEF